MIAQEEWIALPAGLPLSHSMRGDGSGLLCNN